MEEEFKECDRNHFTDVSLSLENFPGYINDRNESEKRDVVFKAQNLRSHTKSATLEEAKTSKRLSSVQSETRI